MAKYSNQSWRELALGSSEWSSSGRGGRLVTVESIPKSTNTRDENQGTQPKKTYGYTCEEILEKVKKEQQEAVWVSLSQSLHPDEELQTLLNGDSIDTIIVPNPMPPQLEWAIHQCIKDKENKPKVIYEPHHRRLSNAVGDNRLKQVSEIVDGQKDIISITSDDFNKMLSSDMAPSDMRRGDIIALPPEIFFNHDLLEAVNFSAVCTRLGIYYTLGAQGSSALQESETPSVTTLSQKGSRPVNMAQTYPKEVIDLSLSKYENKPEIPLRFVGASGAGKDSVIENYYRDKKGFSIFRYNACQGERFNKMISDIRKKISDMEASTEYSFGDMIKVCNKIIVSEANLLDATQSKTLIDLFKNHDNHHLMLTENDGSMTGRRATSSFVQKNTIEIKLPGFDTQDLLQLAKCFLLDALGKKSDDPLTPAQTDVIETVVAYHNSISSMIHPRSKGPASRQLKFAMQAYANELKSTQAYANELKSTHEGSTHQSNSHSKATPKQVLYFSNMQLDKLLAEIKNMKQQGGTPGPVELIIDAESMAPDQRSACNILLDMNASELLDQYNIIEITVAYGSSPLESIGADALNRLQPHPKNVCVTSTSETEEESTAANVNTARELILKNYIQLGLANNVDGGKLDSILKGAPDHLERFDNSGCWPKLRKIRASLQGFNISFDATLENDLGQCIIQGEKITLSPDSNIDLVMKQVDKAKKIAEIYRDFTCPDLTCPDLHFDNSMTYDRNTQNLHLKCHYAPDSVPGPGPVPAHSKEIDDARFSQLIFESILHESEKQLPKKYASTSNGDDVMVAQVIRRRCAIKVSSLFSIEPSLSLNPTEKFIDSIMDSYLANYSAAPMLNIKNNECSTEYYLWKDGSSFDLVQAYNDDACFFRERYKGAVSTLNPTIKPTINASNTTKTGSQAHSKPEGGTFTFYLFPGHNCVEIPDGIQVTPPPGAHIFNNEKIDYLYLPEGYGAGLHFIDAERNPGYHYQFFSVGFYDTIVKAMEGVGLLSLKQAMTPSSSSASYQPQQLTTTTSTQVNFKYDERVAQVHNDPQLVHLRKQVLDDTTSDNYDTKIPVRKAGSDPEHEVEFVLKPQEARHQICLPLIYPACTKLSINGEERNPRDCLHVNQKGQVSFRAKNTDTTCRLTVKATFVDSPDNYTADKFKPTDTHNTDPKLFIKTRDLLSEWMNDRSKLATKLNQDSLPDDYDKLINSLSECNNSKLDLDDFVNRLQAFLAGFEAREDDSDEPINPSATEDDKWEYYFLKKIGHCQHATLISHRIFSFLNIPSRIVESDVHRWVEYWNKKDQMWKTFKTGYYSYSDKLDRSNLLTRLQKHKPITEDELNNTTQSAQQLVAKLRLMLKWKPDNFSDDSDEQTIIRLLEYPAIFQTVFPSILASPNMEHILQKLANYNKESLLEYLKDYSPIRDAKIAQSLLECSIEQGFSPFDQDHEVENWSSLLCKKIQPDTLVQACSTMAVNKDNEFKYHVQIYLYLLSHHPSYASQLKANLMTKYCLFATKVVQQIPYRSIEPSVKIGDVELQALDTYLDSKVSPGIITTTLGGLVETQSFSPGFSVAIIYDKQILKQHFIAILQSYKKTLLNKKSSGLSSNKTESIDVYTAQGIYTVSLQNIDTIYQQFDEALIDDSQSNLLKHILTEDSQFPIIIEAEKITSLIAASLSQNGDTVPQNGDPTANINVKPENEQLKRLPHPRTRNDDAIKRASERPISTVDAGKNISGTKENSPSKTIQRSFRRFSTKRNNDAAKKIQLSFKSFSTKRFAETAELQGTRQQAYPGNYQDILATALQKSNQDLIHRLAGATLVTGIERIQMPTDKDMLTKQYLPRLEGMCAKLDPCTSPHLKPIHESLTEAIRKLKTDIKNPPQADHPHPLWRAMRNRILPVCATCVPDDLSYLASRAKFKGLIADLRAQKIEIATISCSAGQGMGAFEGLIIALDRLWSEVVSEITPRKREVYEPTFFEEIQAKTGVVDPNPNDGTGEFCSIM